jgi:diguanylate cyclase (GGDEF)-like protein
VKSRLKVLLLTNVTLTILFLGIAIGIRQPILQRFADLEQNLMRKKMARIAQTFVQRIEKLDSTAKSEATWAEMYSYVVLRNPGFYNNTFSFDISADPPYELVGIFDLNNTPIHLDKTDSRSRKLKPLLSPDRDNLLKANHLFHFPDDTDLALEDSRNLAVISGEEPLLIASRPIISGEAKAPRRGTLIMGFFVTKELLNQLAKNNDLRIELIPLSPTQSISQNPSPNYDSSSSTYISEIIEIPRNSQPLDDQWIVGQIHFLNSDRQPIQVLSIQSPRMEYQQGVATLNQLTGVLFLVGIPLGIAINLLLDRAMRKQELLKVSEAALFAANLELQKLADLDGLTQIPNRRSFDRFLQKEWAYALREQIPIAMIMCDVDYFKRFNDTYGHLRGDDCLIQVAQAIRVAVRRPSDLIARYGGEEFAIVLLNTNLEGGLLVAQMVQTQVRDLKIEHSGSAASPYVSVSLGIASLVPTLGTKPDILIELSDQNLYIAKQQGRNQIVI